MIPAGVKRKASVSLAILLLFSGLILATISPVDAQASTVRVREKSTEDYSKFIEPGKRAEYEWIVDNPTNRTYSVEITTDSNDPKWSGEMDVTEFDIAPDNIRTVRLTVSTTSDENEDSAVITVRFVMTDKTSSKIYYSNLTARTTIEFDEIHGIDFHGVFKFNPETVGLPDNEWTRFIFMILIWVLLGILVLLIINPVIKGLTKKTVTKVDDIILEIIQKPIFALMVVYGVLDSISVLAIIPKEGSDLLKTLFGMLVILIFTYLAFKLFKGIVVTLGKEFAQKTETEIDDVLVPVIEKIGTVFIGLFGIMGILGYFGIDLTMFAAGMGIMGLIIAFAAQDTLSNFFGGIFLLLDRPFVVGDLILVKEKYCEVKKIGLRSSRLYNIFDHEIIVMPNDDLANSTIVNLSAPDHKYKTSFKIGVAYGTDVEKMETIMLDIIKKAPGVLVDEKHTITAKLNEFQDSYLEFFGKFWVEDIMNQWAATHYIRKELLKRLKEEGIEIPFPHRVVIMQNPVPPPKSSS
jgi:small-conductance mechanosensitive channel